MEWSSLAPGWGENPMSTLAEWPWAGGFLSESQLLRLREGADLTGTSVRLG